MPGRGRIVGAAALVTLLLAATGCSGDSEDDPGRDRPDRLYVALGDSYAAGVGITPARDRACARSVRNYPSQVFRALLPTDQAVRLRDQSCSGAPISSLTLDSARGTTEVPAQLDAVRPTTDLVTIGMGGNEKGVFTTLIEACPQLRALDPTGAPCRDAQRTDDGEDRLVTAVRGVEAAMTQALAQIHDRAPRATVLVVGYPAIAPATGTCPKRLPLADGDVAYFHELTGLLNDSLEAAARASGDTFIDAAAATAGHDICSDDPWVNGQDAGPDGSWPYHPRFEEQQAVAALVLRALGVTPPTPGASSSLDTADASPTVP